MKKSFYLVAIAATMMMTACCGSRDNTSESNPVSPDMALSGINKGQVKSIEYPLVETTCVCLGGYTIEFSPEGKEHEAVPTERDEYGRYAGYTYVGNELRPAYSYGMYGFSHFLYEGESNAPKAVFCYLNVQYNDLFLPLPASMKAEAGDSLKTIEYSGYTYLEFDEMGNWTKRESEAYHLIFCNNEGLNPIYLPLFDESLPTEERTRLELQLASEIKAISSDSNTTFTDFYVQPRIIEYYE